MLRLEGADLPTETAGQIVPYYFGAHQDVPALPLQVGLQATLANNCGVGLAAGGFILSGPDITATLAKAPPEGVVQIESEWMAYNAKAHTPPAIVVTQRGYGGTEVKPHSKGSTVTWVESRPLYVVADMPPGCHYPPDAIADVRIDDLGQVPFHTVRLRDERIVPGHPLVTIEFDLTRSFADVGTTTGLPSSAMMSTIAGGSDAPLDPTSRAIARKRRRLAKQGRLPIRWAGPPRPIAGGVGYYSGGGTYGTYGDYGGWITKSMAQAAAAEAAAASGVKTASSAKVSSKGYSTGVTVKAPPPPAPPPPVTRAAIAKANPATTGGGAVASVVNPGTAATVVTPVRFYSLPLGRVTVDIRGLLDTPAGRYTGTPNAPLEHPVPITRCLLEATYGETDPAQYDRLAWAQTDARQRDLRLTWRLRWTGEAFAAFRSHVGYCGQADLYLDEEGRWVYRFRERTTPAVATIRPRELIGDLDLGWTSVDSLNTSLTVAWGNAGQPASGAFTLMNPAMTRRYGIRTARDLALPYAATETVARSVGRYWLSQWDRPKQTGATGVTWARAALTLTDRVFLDAPIVTLYGAGRVPFEVRGVTDRGGQRVLALVESDPVALAARLSGTIVHVGQAWGVPLAGTFESTSTEVGAPLTGTLVQARTLARPLSGTVEGGELLSIPLSGTVDFPPRQGTLTRSLGLLTATATGSTLPVLQGTAAPTLADLTVAAVGAVLAPGPMPVVDAVTPVNGNGNLTFDHTCNGTDRLLCVGVAIEKDNSSHRVSGITYNGVPLTRLAEPEVTSDSSARCELWALVDPAVGTHPVAITWVNTLSLEWAGAAISFEGVHPAAPFGPVVSAAIGAGANAALTPVQTPADLVLGVLAVNGAPAVTDPNTPRWDRTAPTAGQTRSVGSTRPGTDPATAIGWTHGATDYAAIAVAIHPAPIQPGRLVQTLDPCMLAAAGTVTGEPQRILDGFAPLAPGTRVDF